LRRFHYVEFCLSDDDGRAAYEALMQAMKVDEPSNYELVSETGTWTKDGQHMVSITYIESEPGERY
jgi:hypothetical protein